MSKLEMIPFGKAFTSIPVGNLKVKESEYDSTGSICVVDQGQNLVSGKTKREDLKRNDGPYIVFGDHTRVVKYVNFPFVVGADGVRLYKATNDFEPEFLFFILRNAKLPEDGYGRHSKYLSELTVPSIRKEKQRHIIARLKAQLAEVDKARQAAETQLAETERLRTVLLNKLFTTSENCKPIGFASKVQSGFAFKSQDFSPSGVRLLRNANVTPGEIRWSDVVYLPLEKSKGYGSYSIREGDVIISLDRPIISSGIKVARVTSLDSPSLLVQRVGRFLLDESLLDADYLYVFLQTDRFKEAISGHEQSLGVPHISPGQVEAVETPLPPLAVQQRIGLIAKEVLATTEEARRAAMSMLADISMLPERLLANAFDFAE